jgi:N-dimethylarginine dimethylaminohydrolase
MDLTPATFGGPGWRQRTERHEAEIAAGDIWAPIVCDSEYAPLRDVVLYRPGAAFDDAASLDDKLFVAPVTAGELARGHDDFAAAYAAYGVTVHEIDPGLVDDARHPNTVFQRDVAWPTPFGVVIGRMAGRARAGEERYATATIARAGVPIALTVGGTGTFEGADFLWMRPDLVLCGIGRRTNAEGHAQVAQFLAQYGVATRTVPVPPGVQHLLGGVQIVSESLALVRTEIVDPSVLIELRRAGYDIGPVPEHADVREKCCFNLVAVAPNAVIIPASAWFADVLDGHGVGVAAEVDARYHVRAGGGLACATGVLGREPVAPVRSNTIEESEQHRADHQ